MVSNSNVVDIVRQADNEIVGRRDRWDFKENTVADDQIAKERDVQFERRYAGVLNRLAVCQKIPHFPEQIEANPDQRLSRRSNFQGDWLICGFIHQKAVPRLPERKTVAVDWDSIRLIREEPAGALGNWFNPVFLIKLLLIRPINQNKSRRARLELLVRADQNVGLDASAIKLPGSFEQLKELGDNRALRIVCENGYHSKKRIPRTSAENSISVFQLTFFTFCLSSTVGESTRTARFGRLVGCLRK